MDTLTVEQILAGTSLGRMQTVGAMSVIPLIAEPEAVDETYQAPDLEVSTSHYGTVELRHRGERPTIVPTGAGWVVEEAAQDHAIPSAAFMGAGAQRSIDTAMCIQQSQAGYIRRGVHEMLILPAALRSRALAVRRERGYNKLWEAIGAFNRSHGVHHGGGYGGGHLEYFLKAFARELDEFVAEFELIDDQTGAIVLIGGKVAGVERAPNPGFWSGIWEPLVRVCYGSLAIRAAQVGLVQNPGRAALIVEETSLQGIRDALRQASLLEGAWVTQLFADLRTMQLTSTAPEEQQGSAQLVTLANQGLAGQVVRKDGRIPYASLCTSS